MIIEIVNKKSPNGEKEAVEVKEGKELETKEAEKPVEEPLPEKPNKDPIDEINVKVRYKPYEPDAKAMPDGERWSVKCDGKWYLFKTQRQAVKFARLVAEDRGVDVAVHAPKKVD